VIFDFFLASNFLAQFSRQIVIQILSMKSQKVCGNLAIRPLYIVVAATHAIFLSQGKSISKGALFLMILLLISAGQFICLFVCLLQCVPQGRDVFANYTGTILQVTIIIPSHDPRS
jgi:hypothetical protein